MSIDIIYNLLVIFGIAVNYLHVILKHINIVFIYAMMVCNIMFIDFLANIVYAPVLTVDESYRGTIFEIINIEVLDQGLHHRIPHMSIIKIVS